MTVNKIQLGVLPTPVSPLAKLSRTLGGPEIFIKRDDLTGLGLGGNKTRKLEYILADALEKDCDAVITAGAAQSNHCRQTAAAAAQLGMECHLVLGGSEPEDAEGNLLLDHLFGAHVYWAGGNRKGEDIPAIEEQLLKSGKKPYVVPYGGSNELGAAAFMYAIEELHQQVDAHKFTHIVFASGSGGTHAGLMLGKHRQGAGYQVLGIHVDKDTPGQDSLATTINQLANRTAVLTGGEPTFAASDVVLNCNYVGDGYGIVTDLERQALTLTAQTEGILLDPVYTGRAMGGLVHMIRSGEIGPDERVLFWHTGGAPGLFAYGDKLELDMSRSHTIR